MTERESFKCSELKRQMLIESDYKCQVCGRPLDLSCQLAHIIPNTKYNLKKYGKDLIHHKLNFKIVCSLKCNAAVLIGNNFQEEAELIKRIKKGLNNGK